MEKKIKKIIVVLLMVIILLCFGSFVNRYYINLNKEHAEPLVIYNELLSEVLEDGKYADYYSGAYVKGDKLVIMYTDKNPVITAFKDKYSNVQLKRAKYSYNLLISTYNQLNKYYQFPQSCEVFEENDDFSTIKKLSGWNISEKDNRIIITTTGLSGKEKKLIRHALEEGGKTVCFKYGSSSAFSDQSE